MTRVRNHANIELQVITRLRKLKHRLTDTLTTQTGTVVWYCGKTSVIIYAHDPRMERLSDDEMVDWIVETMNYRILQGIY